MVRLTPEMHAALVADSDEQERTVAQTVRLLIRKHLAARPTPSQPKGPE